MKTLLITFLALVMSFQVMAQDFFWTVYNFKVKNGDDAKVLNAIDKFMESETGKAMPPAILTSKLFGSTQADFTHHLAFFTDDKAVFGKMYSGVLQQSADFQLMGSELDPSIKNGGSYLGKSVETSFGSQGNYRTLISLSVTDPVTYLSEFKKFASTITTQWEGKIGMVLHRFLSGSEPGVTHIAVISAPDFETLLDFSDKIYESKEFSEFNKNVRDIRSPIANNSDVVVRRYNLPND